MAFNIAVTSKYKPFTYDEMVKPLEGYWKKYDEAEEELGTLQNDIAKVKSIIETAPEDDPIRIQALNLYDQLQQEVATLSSEGYSSRGRKARLDLKNTFNTLIPKILAAEDTLRKERAEYAKLQRTGQFITPNMDNPMNFTWADYMDGALPEYSLGIAKKDLYNAGKEASAKISSRVIHDPKFSSARGGTYTAITQEKGLKYDSPEEMMKNSTIASAVEDILNSFNTEGWDAQSIQSLKNEIIRGAYDGLIYDSNTSYQRNPSSPNPHKELNYDTGYEDKDGNRLIVINGKEHWRRPDGTLLRGKENSGTLTKAKQAKIEYNNFFVKDRAIGISDLWRDDPTPDPKKKRNFNDMSKVFDAHILFNNYYNSVLNKEIANSDYTRPLEKVDAVTFTNFYKQGVKNYSDDDTEQKLFTKNTEPDDFIIMVQGGGYENPNSKANEGRETFGDNHRIMIRTEDVVDDIINKPNYQYSVQDKLSIINDLQRNQSAGTKQYSTLQQAKRTVVTPEIQQQANNYLASDRGKYLSDRYLSDNYSNQEYWDAREEIANEIYNNINLAEKTTLYEKDEVDAIIDAIIAKFLKREEQKNQQSSSSQTTTSNKQSLPATW